MRRGPTAGGGAVEAVEAVEARQREIWFVPLAVEISGEEMTEFFEECIGVQKALEAAAMRHHHPRGGE